jgi:hypothetical protein
MHLLSLTVPGVQMFEPDTADPWTRGVMVPILSFRPSIGRRSTTHGRRPGGIAVLVLLLLVSGGGGTADSVRTQASVSGTWDAEFSGIVQGAGTAQTDEFVIELRQRGSAVSGTLRVRGLESPFPVSGEVRDTTFTYTAQGSLGPGCDVAVDGETTVDAAAGRMSGAQTQSTCEGVAIGQVTATRR